MLKLFLPLCGSVLMAAGAASAQQQPRNIFPDRDVAVTYTVTDQSRNNRSTVATHWKAGGVQVRVDLPGDSYAIVDRPADQAMLVLSRQHMVMEMPLSGSPIGPFIPSRAAAFTRGGSDTVAGYRCTIWTLREAQGTATMCLSEDGVVLRAQARSSNGQSGGVLAESVSFRPQPAGLFAPPADYPRIKLPAMAGKALPGADAAVLPP